MLGYQACNRAPACTAENDTLEVYLNVLVVNLQLDEGGSRASMASLLL